MRISYQKSVTLFFILYVIPVVGMWFLVQNRIEERQAATQLFLQNQLDVDRQILTQHGILRSIQPRLRSFILENNGSKEAEKLLISSIKADIDKFQKFWKKYADNFSGKNRPFLQSILKNTQELDLIEEETSVLDEIEKTTNAYLASMLSHLSLNNLSERDLEIHNKFLNNDDIKRDAVYDAINHLADVRYIYDQRVLFFISGENDRQYGFFGVIFVTLAAIMLLLAVLEYFFIHKPFKDIMLFLGDMRAGKRGQRLYFSSPIREIKESENIINEFVSQAEAHEKEK